MSVATKPSAARCYTVIVTMPSRKEARRLTRILLDHRYAACVAMTPVESHFIWKGAVESAREIMLIIKTTAYRYAKLERLIKQHHPYEVPEIIALPIVRGHAAYLGWIRQSVR